MRASVNNNRYGPAQRGRLKYTNLRPGQGRGGPVALLWVERWSPGRDRELPEVTSELVKKVGSSH